MSVLTFEDGHIEYWSTYSIDARLRVFDHPRKASEFMDEAIDYFVRDIRFHKELNGVSVLPSDIK